MSYLTTSEKVDALIDALCDSYVCKGCAGCPFWLYDLCPAPDTREESRRSAIKETPPAAKTRAKSDTRHYIKKIGGRHGK